MSHSLIAVAETAQDVGSGFSKFLDPVADASAEIAALIAECFSTSVALRKLGQAIEEFEYDRSYARIRGDVAIVRESIVYTFQDVQRLFGVGLARATILPGAQYRQVWRDLTAHFQEESNNTLERRLKLYQEFIKDLTWILLEGAPRSRDQFEETGIKIERLRRSQESASLVDDFDRTSIGINRPPSFERVRPREEQIRQPPPEPVRRPERPRPPPMEFDDYDEPFPRRRDPRRRAAWPRNEDDYYDRDRDRYGRPPYAPEVPLSPTSTFSSQSSSSRSLPEHWLPRVFEQGQPPMTPLGITGQTSIFRGEDIGPEARHALVEEYEKLIEIPFENGDLSVRLYYRFDDCRSRILCRTLRPTRSRKECCLHLTALEVERSGPFLKLVRRRTREIWAFLKFPSYEKLVLFSCTFLALRSEDIINPVPTDDSELRDEEELFAGPIIDDHFEHALRLYKDKQSKGVRLEASVVRGSLKRTPVWTAFITHQVQSQRWMGQASPRVVHLADLQRYVFSTEYTPQMAIDGKHELTFKNSRDAREFLEVINELAEEAEDEYD